MEDPRSDSDLIEAVRRGDDVALERLLERHQARIYRFGMKMCRDPEDASDILQETLLTAARNLRSFRGDASLSTWLYTVARSHCVKKRRRSTFAPEREESLESDATVAAGAIADPGGTPLDALANRRLEEALSEAIGALDSESREVLLLRDAEGLSANEVADVVGTSVGAVKSRLHRARVAVRERLAGELGAPSDAPDATCPDVLSLFSRHLEDEIRPEVCAEMERHLQRCDRCRGVCDSLKRTLALCRTTASDIPVPAAVQTSVKVALRDFLKRKP